MHFQRGFALGTPIRAKIKGWDTGREDIEAVVQDCLKIWTSRRMAGFPHSDKYMKSEFEQRLLEVATREENQI